MYASFVDTVPLSAMSNSQPSTPANCPEPVPRGSPSRPTSDSPAEEKKEHSGAGGTGGHGGGEDRRLAAAKDDAPQEQVVVEPTSGTGPDAPSTEAVKVGGGDGHDDGGVEENDDGYHTPTSPRSRIPTDLPCPPAPRKIPAKRRRYWQKGNPGHQEIYRVVRRRVQLSGEFELVLRPVVDGPPAARVDDIVW